MRLIASEIFNLLFHKVGFMATRSVVPRADNEGGMGTALKRWAAGCFNALSSAAHTITGFTVAGFVKNNASGVLSGGNSLAAGDIPAAVDAAKIGAGAVSNTEFGYLDGVTSALQTQLGAKAPVASPSFSTKITVPIIDLAGGQIAFPAAQAASANANTFDDYEEGSWVPLLKFGGASVGVAYDADLHDGSFTKIGRQVTCTCVLALTNKGSSVGNAVVYGLPFPAGAGAGNYSCVAVRLGLVTFADSPFGQINPLGSTVGLHEITVGGVTTPLTDGNFVNTSVVILTFSYFV